jgi:hypothetical protein
MELQKREADDRSLFSDNLIKTAIVGAILAGVGAALFRRKRPRSHTIPPIIIRSVDTGPDPIEIETERELYEARALDQKVEYETDDFGLTKWVVVELRKGNDWVKYGFGRQRGLEVRISFQIKQLGTWINESGAPHLIIHGRSEHFPLTSDELSSDMPGNSDRPHKRHYNKGNSKRRIGTVEVVGFQPLSTAGNDQVEVGFFDH